MAHARAETISARLGGGASPSSRSARVAKRRRVFLLVVGLVIFTFAALANYGPLHAYMDARARLDKATGSVAGLEAEKAELQSELGRLSEADYLESLARQDLAYARPGEELYIITEAGGGAGQAGSAYGTGQAGGSGFLERLLAPLLYGP